jgi:hypothetical protein
MNGIEPNLAFVRRYRTWNGRSAEWLGDRSCNRVLIALAPCWSRCGSVGYARVQMGALWLRRARLIYFLTEDRVHDASPLADTCLVFASHSAKGQ